MGGSTPLLIGKFEAEGIKSGKASLVLCGPAYVRRIGHQAGKRRYGPTRGRFAFSGRLHRRPVASDSATRLARIGLDLVKPRPKPCRAQRESVGQQRPSSTIPSYGWSGTETRICPARACPRLQSPQPSEGYGYWRFGVRGRPRGPSGSPRLIFDFLPRRCIWSEPAGRFGDMVSVRASGAR
jgi:hypothetical protein